MTMMTMMMMMMIMMMMTNGDGGGDDDCDSLPIVGGWRHMRRFVTVC